MRCRLSSCQLVSLSTFNIHHLFRTGSCDTRSQPPGLCLVAVLSLILSGWWIGVPDAAAKSLWNKTSSNYKGRMADKTARLKGDILTVVISETNTLSNTVSTTTEKDAQIENVVTSFFFPAAASNFGSHNGALPNTDIEGQNDYTGGGTIANTLTLTGKASVMVIDVLPNGNLVIEGVRVVTASGETQYAVLHGFVRPYDITSDNMVMSDRIADARVEYISEGSLTEAQKKGWLMRLNDAINPF